MEDHKPSAPKRAISRIVVETAAARIAGQVVELFELSKNGEVDIRAEGTFEIGKRCDFVVEQQLSQKNGARRREGLITL